MSFSILKRFELNYIECRFELIESLQILRPFYSSFNLPSIVVNILSHKIVLTEFFFDILMLLGSSCTTSALLWTAPVTI